jgi:hypothetical protein
MSPAPQKEAVLVVVKAREDQRQLDRYIENNEHMDWRKIGTDAYIALNSAGLGLDWLRMNDSLTGEMYFAPLASLKPVPFRNRRAVP